MKYIPRVNVVYHGNYHRSQIPFEIDENDADEMKLYGEVIKPEVDMQVETQDEPKPAAKPKVKKK